MPTERGRGRDRKPVPAPGSTRPGAFAAFGAGVLAALAGAGAGHLAAALSQPAASPVLAVGSTVIDLTPTPVKEWAVAELGSADKPVLVGSVLAGTLLLAGVAGVVARRHLALGTGLLVGLVGVATAAAVTRPGAGPADSVPGLVAMVAGVAALRLLLPPADTGTATGTEGDRSAARVAPGRRSVLLAAGVAAFAAATGAAGRWVTAYRSRGVDVALPAPADGAGSFPRGLEERVPGVTPLRTPEGEFYRVDTRLSVPVIDPDSWTLTIDGDVEREVTFTFDDLLAMPLVERDITLACVSNSVGGEYVGGARWLGVPLVALLERAGVGDRADQILSTDVDGMTISTPLDLATDGRDAMIAVGMNGEGLPREHGFPARMVVPGLYGFISACKWITRMTLTTYADDSAYWTDRGWVTDAPIKISSRIDTPRALETVPAGRRLIGGVAWAQQRGGVAAVEVRIDGGAWQPARLGPDVGNDYWRQWYLPWTAEPGRHSLAVRAVSGDGEVQTAVRAEPFPAGASGIQELLVDVE